MIITRTPLRISLGGGGTDLPSYYRLAGGGFLIAAAITKYVYIAVHRNFDDDILLKYSRAERVTEVDAIRHPLLRECLRFTGVEDAIEISSMADIPAGTGLGSSGAFAVGTLKAIRAYKREYVSNLELARQACHLEIEVLGEPVGKQDQFIAATGGVTAFDFKADDTVSVGAVALEGLTHDRLEENLLLFFTGMRRSASEVLWDQDQRARAVATDIRANLDCVKALGRQTLKALDQADLHAFGELLTEQWKAKFQRSPTAIHREIDTMISAGIDAGAWGGKLVGAGGGGFLLFYAEEKAQLREVMSRLGLEEVRFGFDHEGASTVVT